jgi:hypothetical protein
LMAWLHEFPETSENVTGSSQNRWTPKVPVVSVVLSRPSASSVPRREHRRRRDSQVLDDAAVYIEITWYPKTPCHSVENVGVDHGSDIRLLIEVTKTPKDVSVTSQHRWTSKVPVVSAVLSRPSASSVPRREHRRHRDS